MIVGNTNCIDVTPIMTSNTTPSPYVVSATSTNTEPYKMFDNDPDTFYRSGINFTTGTICIDMGSEVVVDCYSLNNNYNAALYSMNTWTLEGSNDNSEWTVLHSVSSKNDWVLNETYSYFFANNQAYRYYRINCTAKNGSNSICISEMKLYQSQDTEYVVDKINESELPSSVSDGYCHIYFTNLGNIYVTDKMGIPKLMNERILGINFRDISKIYTADSSETGYEKMVADTSLSDGDFAKADNWIYKIVSGTPVKVMNANPVTRDTIYEGLVNAVNTTCELKDGCSISNYDMLEIHVVVTYSKANYENVVFRPVQEISTSNKITVGEYFGGSTSNSICCEFTYTDTSFTITKFTANSNLSNRGISKIVGIKYNK